MPPVFSPQHCMPPMYALGSPYQPVGPGFAPTQYNMQPVCFPNGFQGTSAKEASRVILVADPLYLKTFTDVLSPLTLSGPIVSSGYTLECSAPYWSNPPFLIF